MATRDFNASWADIYNTSGGWSLAHHNHPIRTGGGSGTNWQTLIRIPDAVKTAIRESSTPAQLHMRIYFTSSANEIDVGHHRERNRRSIGARGIPWYAYNETWRSISNGWNSYQMTNWFMPQFLSGNVQGIVLYSANGRFNNTATGVGQTNSVRFRVTGTWNTAPSNPSNVRVDKNQVDILQTVRWNASTDAEGDSLVYQLDYYNGLSWRRIANGHSGTHYNFDTTDERYSNQAKFRVRAYDGELYSAWRESPEFGVEHVPPQISFGMVEYEDINPSTTAITGNNMQMIQNASIPRISVIDAFANDGKTIKRFIVSLDGQERSSTTAGTFTFDPIEASSNQTLRVTVEDSAGLRSSTTRTIQVLPYELPKVQYTAQRVGSIEDATILSVSGSISSVNGRNSLQTTRYRYRQVGGNWTTWRTLNRSVSGNNFTASNVTLNLDNNLEWEIQIQITDRISTRDIYADVGRGSPIMFIDESNDRLGIGRYPTRGSLDIAGSMYMDGEIHLQNSNFPENEVALVSHTLTGGNPGIEITSNKNPHGYAYIDFNTTRATDVDGGGDSRILASHGDPQVDGDGILRLQSGDIRMNASRGIELDGRIDLNGSVFINGDGIARYYTNSLGHYIRFYNGIQICWNNATRESGIGYNRNNKLYTSNNLSVSYPSSFIELPAVTVTGNVGGLHASIASANISNNVDYFGLRFIGEDYSSSVGRYNYIAIGRWK